MFESLISSCVVSLLQVCEERLQFSLSENVKTNVLWGSTVKDTVTLRPWGEQIKENSTEVVTEDDEKQEERYNHTQSINANGPHNDVIKIKTVFIAVKVWLFFYCCFL